MALSTQPIDPSLSVNDLLRRHPETIRILTEKGIDTCCDGGLSLTAAAADAELDVSVLVRELAAVIAANPSSRNVEATR